jgi:hypothetical protein
VGTHSSDGSLHPVQVFQVSTRYRGSGAGYVINDIGKSIGSKPSAAQPMPRRLAVPKALGFSPVAGWTSDEPAPRL